MTDGSSSLSPDTIECKMHELERILNVTFNDLGWLKKAMCVNKLNDPDAGENNKDYANTSLATVGDTILKFVISEVLYDKGKGRGEITMIKSEYEKNSTLFSISNDLGIYRFAFNEKYFFDDAPEHERLPNPKDHTTYIEAIIAAIYYDSGFDSCRKWIKTELLEKHSGFHV